MVIGNIIANGELLDLDWHLQKLKEGMLVCADGGANYAFEMGIMPKVVIGDMDSLSQETKEWIQANNITFLKSPCEKDETDTGLAIEWLLANVEGISEINIFGALGNRLDHTLANIQLLLTGYRKGIKIKLIDKIQTVFLVTDEWAGIFEGMGRTISLLAYSPKVEGVTTENLQYPLSNATLTYDVPIGVSNILTADTAKVTVKSGILLAIINN